MTTPQITKLLDDAEAAGLQVDRSHNQFARVTFSGNDAESVTIHYNDSGGFDTAQRWGAQGQAGDSYGSLKAVRSALDLGSDSSD